VFNVPKARSDGIEAELFARMNDNWDFGISATVVDAELRSSVTSVSNGSTVVVGGLEKGNRLPTAPKFQGAASIGYTMPVMGGDNDLFANLTYQHVGSSYSQFENEVDNFGFVGGDGSDRRARLISLAPTSLSEFAFDTKLASYDIANFRVGLRGDQWEAAVFVNNLTDEEARLALDYERGRSARVGYLTNQPRTIGITLSRSF
jgi:iron complex outermembrane receptor protein